MQCTISPCAVKSTTATKKNLGTISKPAKDALPCSLASFLSSSCVARRLRKSSRQRDGTTCSTRTWMRFLMIRPFTCARAQHPQGARQDTVARMVVCSNVVLRAAGGVGRGAAWPSGPRRALLWSRERLAVQHAIARAAALRFVANWLAELSEAAKSSPMNEKQL